MQEIAHIPEPSRGERFRAEVLAGLEPGDPAAMQLLDACAQTLDELEQLEADVRARGVTIIGARGQPIQHPALAAITRHRQLLQRLLEGLLPEAKESMTEQQRRAGRARWGK
jgi:phage terminase small subunit